MIRKVFVCGGDSGSRYDLGRAIAEQVSRVGDVGRILYVNVLHGSKGSSDLQTCGYLYGQIRIANAVSGPRDVIVCTDWAGSRIEKGTDYIGADESTIAAMNEGTPLMACNLAVSVDGDYDRETVRSFLGGVKIVDMEGDAPVIERLAL